MFPGVVVAIRPDYTRYQNPVTEASEKHSLYQTSKKNKNKNNKFYSQTWLPPSDQIIPDIKTLSQTHLKTILTIKHLKKKLQKITRIKNPLKNYNK